MLSTTIARFIIPSVRNLLPLPNKVKATGYRVELDPVAWAYRRGRITPTQLDLYVADKERRVAIERFSPPDEWAGLDKAGNLIVRQAWRRRIH